jgi:hypothetical protein
VQLQPQRRHLCLRTHSCSVAPPPATKRASSVAPLCVGTARTQSPLNTFSCVKYAKGASAGAVGAFRPYAPNAFSIMTPVATLQKAWFAFARASQRSGLRRACCRHAAAGSARLGDEVEDELIEGRCVRRGGEQRHALRAVQRRVAPVRRQRVARARRRRGVRQQQQQRGAPHGARLTRHKGGGGER